MKKFITYFITLFFIICFPVNSFASSGEDRCLIKDCLCRVTPGPGYNYKTAFSRENRLFSIYFKKNSYELKPLQGAAIRKFLSKLSHLGTSLSIIGYTDGCGSVDHNKRLSLKRANKVSAIAKEFPKKLHIKVIPGGEKSKDHKPEARRVDIIAHTKDSITTAIEKIPSDFYLIDASGSMWSDYEKWKSVISASIKPKGKVFLSIVNGCSDGQPMKSVRPHGGTEIWWSYWNLIDRMRPGQSLLIISDFESRVPLSKREFIMFRRKVLKANITVRAITP